MFYLEVIDKIIGKLNYNLAIGKEEYSINIRSFITTFFQTTSQKHRFFAALHSLI